MNAPKLLTLAAFSLLLFWLLPKSTATMSVWKSKSHSDESSNFSWTDDLPEAYQLLMVFPDYTHTHTVNGGTTLIHIAVRESETSLSMGMVTRSNAHYTCDVNGPDISGDISIDIATDYVGTISEKSRKDKLREKAIHTIIDKFANL